MKKIHDTIVEQLAAFAQSTGFTDCVIGLSGGLDSSVVAPLCVEALGPDHVHGVMLPGPYSTDHSLTDARELADALGMDSSEISIAEPFAAFERVLGPACGGALDGLAAENAQARCRMVCLMALSNKHGWMLVNTGNRSEALMGYCTLYGDMAGAFAPIGGLYKHQVRALGRYINEDFEARGLPAPIPENVFVKPPSAELSPDQSDEESLGVDYDTLDAILMAHFDEGLSAEHVAARGFDLAQAQRIIATAEGYAFKRALLPPCASIAR